MDLSHRNVKYISNLGNVHSLYLSKCKNVSDVSALLNVNTLILNNCINIKDKSLFTYFDISYEYWYKIIMKW